MKQKLQELILYIAHKSHDDPAFSSTKLNKILFFSDFFAYGLWDESITGSTYIRNHHGPTVKGMLQVQEALETANRASIEERPYFGYPQKRLIPLANPDLSLFTPEEIQLVHHVMHECRELTATQLSDMTHTLQPWLDAEEGEEIPLETVYVLKKVPVGAPDFAWAEQAIAELESIAPS